MNAQLTLVLASFWFLWLLPLGISLLLLTFAVDGRVPLTAGLASLVFFTVFAAVTVRVWQVSRAAPGEQLTEPPGVRLQEGDAPELFQLAAQLREQTRMDKPVEVWCDLSAIVSAVAYSAHMAVETKIALRNGFLALAALSREQLEILLRYHLRILTFSPRLMSMLLKARGMSLDNPYFLPYLKAFDWSIRKVERFARANASASIDVTCAAIETSQEVTTHFELFWATEMRMFLQTGHLMPFAEGFAMHWKDVQAKAGKPVPEPAIAVLRSASRVEHRLTASLLGQNPTLERTSWEQGGVILFSSWVQAVEHQAEALAGLCAGQLCELLRDNGIQLGSRMFEKPGRLHQPEELRLWASQILGMAFAVALGRSGWRFLYTGASSKLEFERDGKTIEPFTAIQRMLTGQMECPEWAELCQSYGIVDLSLESH